MAVIENIGNNKLARTCVASTPLGAAADEHAADPRLHTPSASRDKCEPRADQESEKLRGTPGSQTQHPMGASEPTPSKGDKI